MHCFFEIPCIAAVCPRTSSEEERRRRLLVLAWFAGSVLVFGASDAQANRKRTKRGRWEAPRISELKTREIIP